MGKTHGINFPLLKSLLFKVTPPPSLFHFQNELMNKFIYLFNHQNIHKLFPSFFLSKFLGNIISRLFSEQFSWENLTRALSGGVNNYHDYCGLMGWGGYETTTVWSCTVHTKKQKTNKKTPKTVIIKFATNFRTGWSSKVNKCNPGFSTTLFPKGFQYIL